MMCQGMRRALGTLDAALSSIIGIPGNHGRTSRHIAVPAVLRGVIDAHFRTAVLPRLNCENSMLMLRRGTVATPC